MATIDKELNSRFENDKHRMITNIIFTGNWLKNLYVEFLRPYGLSSQQFNILRILRGAGDWLPMSQVKERMIERAPNATRLADKILAKGLLERERSGEDRRVVYVRITQEGLDLLKKVDIDLEGFNVDHIERFTEEEAKMVSTVLDKMRG